MKSDMFIDPKSDYAFKRFFGTVSNKELTIGFLNSLLNKDIKDIIFHNVEMQGNNTDSRKARKRDKSTSPTVYFTTLRLLYKCRLI